MPLFGIRRPTGGPGHRPGANGPKSYTRGMGRLAIAATALTAYGCGVRIEVGCEETATKDEYVCTQEMRRQFFGATITVGPRAGKIWNAISRDPNASMEQEAGRMGMKVTMRGRATQEDIEKASAEIDRNAHVDDGH